MTGFHTQAWMTIAGALTFGMLLSLVGSSRRTLVGWLQLTPEQAGGLLSVLVVALIPFMVLAGILADIWGAREVLCLGSILSSLALAILLSKSRPSYLQGLLTAILAAAGAALLNCGTTVMMPRAFFDNNPVASTNLGFLFVGLGALITPVIADLLLQFQQSGFRWTLSLFALLCLAPLLAAVSTTGESMAVTRVGSVHPDIFLRPSLWLCGAVFVLYGPLEGWLSASGLPFLKRSGFTERQGAVLLAATWLAFLGSRFLVAFLQQSEQIDPESDHLIMLLLAGISTVALGNLIGAHRVDAICTWMILIGASLGPVFSSLVGFLFMNFEPQEYGTAYGTMFAVGASGSLILAPLYSPRAGKPMVNDKTALRLLTGISLALIAVILAAWITR